MTPAVNIAKKAKIACTLCSAEFYDLRTERGGKIINS
jgi:hypothetical protein